MSRSPPPPSQFFIEDIVRQVNRDPDDTEDDLAIVLRHWHDSDPADLPPEHRDDPLNRALEPGEVGISVMLTGVHEIVREEDYYLVDRSMQPGDLVKRSVYDVQSGIVLESKVQVKLEHAISMHQYTSWVSADELENATEVYVGDFILYDDWVGQIEEIFDEAVVELTSGQLYGFAELGSRVQIGDRGPDILPDAALRALQQQTSELPEVLVSIKPTVIAIGWLALNQKLDPDAASGKQRPKQFWTVGEYKDLCLVRPRSVLRVSDRVRFKDESLAEMHGVRNTRHGDPSNPNNFIESDILVVRETETSVRVLWQDGSISSDVRSTELIPYSNPDEYDCWPGDHVLWKGDDESRAGVVQFVNAADRTAQVFWKTPPSNPTPGSKPPSYSLVSVLELDPHGQSTVSPDQPDCIGVRRGDFVFIHKDGTTNGSVLPRVPRIGELSPEAHQEGWRHMMTHVGSDYMLRDGARKLHVASRSGEENSDGISWRDPSAFDWFGEVTSLRSSGDVEITLPSGNVTPIPLQRLTLLMDSRDDLAALWAEEGMEMDEDAMPTTAGLLASLPAVAQQALSQLLGLQQGHGHTHTHVDDDAGSQGSWEDYSGDDDEMDAEADAEMPGLASIDQEPPVPMTSAPDLSTLAPPSTDGDDANQAPTPPSSSHLAVPPPIAVSTPSSTAESPLPSASLPMDEEDDGPWVKFKVLPSAPPDHAFLSKGGKGQPSRQYMARLSKEYKLFSGSLPDTIIVRAYEDRTDLLRSLIIGPENTPYEGAPFVIDWFLEDTFPQTPPQAHFHSWTNGNGRVNPNLYEEGKVCLSILGTWAGDKSECWSPSRSSLMQALVSIQGLVLVKEPWFCEPAFEKLRGTQDGIVNSRLYNEKAYVLSRGFVRRALENSPGSLQRELEWMYYDQGRLSKVIDDAKTLIDASGRSGGADMSTTIPGWEDKAVPKLTPGGILPLQRTLARLETILAGRQQQAS